MKVTDISITFIYLHVFHEQYSKSFNAISFTQSKNRKQKWKLMNLQYKCTQSPALLLNATFVCAFQEPVTPCKCTHPHVWEKERDNTLIYIPMLFEQEKWKLHLKRSTVNRRRRHVRCSWPAGQQSVAYYDPRHAGTVRTQEISCSLWHNS
jgi:hypothetical protein